MIDCPPPPPLQPAAVIEPALQWYVGETISIAFVGGDEQTQARIMAIEAGPDGWSSAIGGVTIVFVDDPMLAEVRVGFEAGGSWSYVGRDTLRVPAPRPTMNLGWALIANDQELQHLWLHELGHALGFTHEWGDGDAESVMMPGQRAHHLSALDRSIAAEWYGAPVRYALLFPLVIGG